MNSPRKRPFRSCWWIQPPFWSESTIFSLRLAGASKLRISRYIKIHQDTYQDLIPLVIVRSWCSTPKKEANGGWSESGFCWFPRLEVLLIEAKNLFPRSRDPRDPRDPDPCGSLPAVRKSCWSPIDGWRFPESWRATPSHHPFRTVGLSITNQLLGYPDLWKSPHVTRECRFFFFWLSWLWQLHCSDDSFIMWLRKNVKLGVALQKPPDLRTWQLFFNEISSAWWWIQQVERWQKPPQKDTNADSCESFRCGEWENLPGSWGLTWHTLFHLPFYPVFPR